MSDPGVAPNENDGHCPKCGANGWVLNPVTGHQHLVDVCINCGYTERSQVKRGRVKK